MKKIKILELTDAKGGDCEFYSEQFEALLNGIHISQTDYYLTDGNYIVEIENGIDLENNNVKNAISNGAIIEEMYYVDDKTYSENLYDFDAEGFYDGVEYGEEHGVIFQLESDAVNYEEYIRLNNPEEIVKKLNEELIGKIMPIKDINFICINAIKDTKYESERGMWEAEEDKVLIMENNYGCFTFGVTEEWKGCFGVDYEVIERKGSCEDDYSEDIFDTLVKVCGVSDI